MPKLAKLKAMSGKERRWLLQAWLLLPVVKILLWQIGYRRTVANLERWLPLPSGDFKVADRETQQQAVSLSHLVNMAANHSPLVINCLPRSLVLWGMLRRAGLVTDLRIGVQKESAAFSAHAWVEFNGQALNEDATVVLSYNPFAGSCALPSEELSP